MKSYVIALIVVVGVLAGFYGGYKVGQNNVSASTNTGGQFARTGSNGSIGGGRGFGAACPSPGAPSPSPGTQAVARGSVADLASGAMTVTSTACEVKVKFGPTVTVQKQAAGSTADLQDNQTVTITGTRQADGSILATTILIGNGSGLRIGAGAGTGG
ncbi:MAG TPA: hypothetical protein VJT78_02470 [Candidatus Dormibacteraeota bacterium]|nr:hypothetical protein [Candidatus Dormibacteraeota bacterium]